MGFLDRLLGRTPAPMNTDPAPRRSSGSQPVSEDQAVARYRYLLRTASPDQLEAVHAEAFARLTPEQRQQLLQELGSSLPPGERVTSDSPQDLARAATRAEARQPGFMEQTFGRSRFGGGMAGGGMAVRHGHGRHAHGLDDGHHRRRGHRLGHRGCHVRRLRRLAGGPGVRRRGSRLRRLRR